MHLLKKKPFCPKILNKKMTLLFVKTVMGEEADLMKVSVIQQALRCPPLTFFPMAAELKG